MKIGNPADKPVPLPAIAANAPADAAKTGAAHNVAPAALPVVAEASSHVALSSAASSLLSTGNSAEFDSEKVAKITDAIAAGKFKIDAGAIADKLISNAQELLGNVKG